MQLVENQLTETILGAAIEVHRYWGPGLLEDIYEKSLAHELSLRGLDVQTQFEVPILYKDQKVGDSLRVDLMVESKVVLELKSVSEVHPIHEAQLFTYMRLTSCRVGFLINFNVKLLKEGVRRRVL